MWLVDMAINSLFVIDWVVALLDSTSIEKNQDKGNANTIATASCGADRSL
ncbi:hypothetical protein [Porticoccus sp.]|nr:hypothetical protein [Porticoccus sp.]|tara:strand:+ start:5630 stop:5779 length:150 start_codon:yes stop_codon:yes gene_type:complete